MNFKTAGLLVGASTILRLLGGVLTVKVIAVSTGPQGLGQLGQLMSLLAICVLLAAGGTQNGVITGLPQRRQDAQAEQRFWLTASTLGLGASFIVASVILATAAPLSQLLFKSENFVRVIELFALLQFALSFAALASAKIIADKKTQTFAVASSIAVIAGLSGMAWLAATWGVLGAAYGLLWSACCPAIVYAAHQLWRSGWPRWRQWGIHWPDALYLGKFSLMVLISAIAMPLVQILLRDRLLEHGGWSEVGGWQAVLRYSDASLQFIGALLSSYFLPRVATVNDRLGLQRLVSEAYRFLVPVVAVITLFTFQFAAGLVALLFSREFGSAVTLLPWQSCGDALRSLSLVLGFVGLSRGNLRLHVAAEFFQGGMMLLAGWMLIGRYGAAGASYAYVLTYALYLPLCVLVYRIYLRALPTTPAR